MSWIFRHSLHVLFSHIILIITELFVSYLQSIHVSQLMGKCAFNMLNDELSDTFGKHKTAVALNPS